MPRNTDIYHIHHHQFDHRSTSRIPPFLGEFGEFKARLLLQKIRYLTPGSARLVLLDCWVQQLYCCCSFSLRNDKAKSIFRFSEVVCSWWCVGVLATFQELSDCQAAGNGLLAKREEASRCVLWSFQTPALCAEFTPQGGEDEGELSTASMFKPSHVSIAGTSLVWIAMLNTPLFKDYWRKGRERRRFWWALLRGPGIWQSQFLGCLPTMPARGFSDWEEAQYKHNVRMGREAFLGDCMHLWKTSLTKKDTHPRKCVPSSKRLALNLHWFAHAPSFAQLALLYGVGATPPLSTSSMTTAAAVFKAVLVPKSIKFPEGAEINSVMTDFKDLCGLPQCAGTIDGACMDIVKPARRGDVYWCY